MNVRLTKEQKIKVANSDDIFSIMQQVLLRENRLARKQEHFWVIGLESNNRIEFIELVSLGGVNSASVAPFEVFSLASAKKTPKVILVHNHPSGELSPSEDDKKITKALVEGSKILRVEVLDHIIISEEGYYSFQKNKIMPK